MSYNKLRKLFIEAVLSELQDTEIEKPLSKEVSNELLMIAKDLGVEDVMNIQEEGVISSSVKALVILSLLAIAENSSHIPTRVVKNVSDITLEYIVTPIKDEVIQPIIDKIESTFDKGKEKAEDTINSVKDVSDRSVKVVATFSNDTKELLSAKAEVAGKEVNLEVNKMSNKLKSAFSKKVENEK